VNSFLSFAPSGTMGFRAFVEATSTVNRASVAQVRISILISRTLPESNRQD